MYYQQDRGRIKKYLMSKTAADLKKSPWELSGDSDFPQTETTNVLQIGWPNPSPSQENVYITAGFKCKVS